MDFLINKNHLEVFTKYNGQAFKKKHQSILSWNQAKSSFDFLFSTENTNCILTTRPCRENFIHG